ncbi:MAG: amidohydrolase family protein, partial [Hyphomicrobiaceae bacterium]
TAGNAPIEPFIEAWGSWLAEPALGDDFLKLSGLFVDVGPSEANTLLGQASPYTGWAGFNYDTGQSRERVKEILLACARYEIRAIAIWPNMLDLFEEVDREIPLAGRRWVLGHIGVVTPRDVERIARMGLVVSTHTNRYVYKDGHTIQGRLPPERHGDITPVRDMLDAGIKVSLATDNVPVSLFWPIWQTVSRMNRFIEAPIVPEQAITREEALRCATSHGAYMTFDETKKGSLESGKLADLAVLSADPLSVAEPEIRDIRSTMTMVGGKIVHEEAGWDG